MEAYSDNKNDYGSNIRLSRCHCVFNIVYYTYILIISLFFSQILAVIQFIVSIAAATENNQSVGGYKSASFAAIWSMFLIIGFAVFAQRIVHNNNKNDAIWVGFLIGASGMLCQLCLMLAAVFFTLGEAATTLGYKTAPADKAFGSFSLFNFIMYFIWTSILATSREAITESAEGSKEVEEEGEGEVAEDEEVQNDDENGDEQI